ncbi:MAG: transposase [Candidatus Heimdallarchaeota archaeon]|nr:transposase [Candidatus Heimdallarchaeota archaeon]
MSREVRTTVKVKIKSVVITSRKRRRLQQITGRDTRIINHYVKTIYHNKDKLGSKHGKKKVNKAKLDHLTLTTSKKTLTPPRPTVRHDLKKRFPRCSQNELQECRENAVAIHHSQQQTMEEPHHTYLQSKLPRTQLAHRKRFVLTCSPNNTIARWWLGIRDSLDSKKNNTTTHAKLWLPLACSPYHEYKLQQGKIKALELIYYPKQREWWVHFILSHSPEKYTSSRPPAVLGIDLGINKRAVTALLTPKGVIQRHEIRFWSDKTRKTMLNQHEQTIAKMQKKLANPAISTNQRQTLLRQLKSFRKKKRAEHRLTDHTYVNKLVKYILSLGKRYDLYVVVGFPINIRKGQFRGNQRPYTRKIVHLWNYRRVIELLKFKLSLQGWEEHRILAIGESWTSSTCSRCGSYHTQRPTQPTFICNTCGYQLNADLNGSKNIAKRLVKYVLQPKYSTIKDLLTGKYFPLRLFRVFTVLSQWL